MPHSDMTRATTRSSLVGGPALGVVAPPLSAMPAVHPSRPGGLGGICSVGGPASEVRQLVPGFTRRAAPSRPPRQAHAGSEAPGWEGGRRQGPSRGAGKGFFSCRRRPSGWWLHAPPFTIQLSAHPRRPCGQIGSVCTEWRASEEERKHCWQRKAHPAGARCSAVGSLQHHPHCQQCALGRSQESSARRT